MQTNKISKRTTKVLSYHSMLMYSSTPCFEHSNLFTVNDRTTPTDQLRPARANLRMEGNHNNHEPLRVRHRGPTRNPTTSFLTATTLIYAIGAGITAAAGTRLALQLILDKGFKLFSFQLQDLKRPCIVIYCHYLPESGLGNLRACCLPWMW